MFRKKSESAAKVPAEVSNAETAQVEPRNGSANAHANSTTPAQTQDDNRLEVGGNEADVESPSVPAVPDGGWGWVVVIGSFMIHVIADGIAYSFGVFVEDFVDYFECSKSAVGGLGSLMLGVTWGSGNITECVSAVLLSSSSS